jgi:hypothetical protein
MVGRKLKVESSGKVSRGISISACIHEDNSVVEVRFAESRIEVDGDF